jgi:hypothetical protein
MQFILGLAVMLVFFICLGLAFYIGYRLGSRDKAIKERLKRIAEEEPKEQRELKRRMEGLQNIMNYDIRQAMGVKHE